MGDLVKAEWVSYIKIEKSREAKIQSCFNCDTEFHYPKTKKTFENLLQEFRLRSWSETSDNNITDIDSSSSSYVENIKSDCLIIMYNASGLAVNSKKFASFLIVARKFNYHCVYMFHTTHPEKLSRSLFFHKKHVKHVSSICSISKHKKILEADCIR